MHETGIVDNLVRRVELDAQQAGAVRVSEVTVWLGALSQFSAAHFREHFDDAARGTPLEHAALRVDVSDDVADPNAQCVILQSVALEVPDDEDVGGESVNGEAGGAAIGHAECDEQDERDEQGMRTGSGER